VVPFPQNLQVPPTDFKNVSPFIYSVRVLDGKRGGLIEHLRARDIEVGVHFIPVHKHQQFANCRFGDMTVTDRVVEEVLTLPLHSCMLPEYVERVIDGVRGFLSASL